MNSSIKTIGVILLLLTGICSGRDAKGFRNVVNPTNPSREKVEEKLLLKQVYTTLLSRYPTSDRRKNVRHAMYTPVVAVEMKMREPIADDAFLDYVQPIPNPRHEKGKPGGGNNK